MGTATSVDIVEKLIELVPLAALLFTLVVFIYVRPRPGAKLGDGILGGFLVGVAAILWRYTSGHLRILIETVYAAGAFLVVGVGIRTLRFGQRK